jgi:hypothetical protein
MSQYIITYIGGNKPASKEEGMAQMAKYKSWLSALGESAVSPANPLGKTHTVGPDGAVTEGGISAMSGYTIIETESIDDAIAVARDCPFLEMGGSLEVSELMQMPG